MLDDFFTRALIAGIGVALITGPLGCFIVWRRLAYFGDSLSHAALLGVAFGLIADVNLTFAIFVVCIAVAAFLLMLQSRAHIPSDALLGIFSHGALSIGLVALALMAWIRIDLMGLLFGDILAVSKLDIVTIYAGGAVIIAIMAKIWRPLFAATVNPELAEAEGMNPKYANMIFTLLIASVIALSIKIVGAMLITAMLIIPAATARRFAISPEMMALVAGVFGILAVTCGLFSSLQWDTPSGPSIVVTGVIFFAISQSPLCKPLAANQRSSGTR